MSASAATSRASSSGASASDIESVLALARPEILALKPYEHASWAPELERLHANESPWRPLSDSTEAGLNRYPEPQPRALVAALAGVYGVTPAQLLVGRGSDEGIDLLVRAFCPAGASAVLVCPPTFGMYAVAARIQGAEVVSVPLRRQAGSFVFDTGAVLAAFTPRVKLVFLCSPNNPTGASLPPATIERVLEAARGRAVVVLDEAYAEFDAAPSFASRLAEFPHLVLLRTMSKAHGLAGARVGSLIAHPTLVALLRKIIPPYAMPQPTVEAALAALRPAQLASTGVRIAELIAERENLRKALGAHPSVLEVFPSEANFLLVEFVDAERAFRAFEDAKLLVRDFRSQPGLERCLRITIGSPGQNARLLAALEREGLR